MKVVNISVANAGGGAHQAAARLHRGLHEIGLESEMLVVRKSGHDATVRTFAPPPGIQHRIQRLARRVWLGREARKFRPSAGSEIFSTDRSIYGGRLAQQIGTVDIINLHWVANLFDYHAFFRRLSPDIPIVWTLHDMNPFTGGCHYDAGCGRFASRCGSCPQFDSSSGSDLTRIVWTRKSSAFAQLAERRLALVCPSQWLANECRRSSLLGNRPLSVIPNGLDTDTFKPIDRHAARADLGIPQDAWVILFVAQSLTNRRKGFQILLDTLGRLAGIPHVHLLTVGKGRPQLPTDIPTIMLSATLSERHLASIYSAANVFVIPSLQDNLPNTVLESMACGTPVVAFHIGGIPDMVRPGETGCLAPPGDSTSLAEAIMRLAEDESLRRSLGANCRIVAENEYSLNRQAVRYRELYQSLIPIAV